MKIGIDARFLTHPQSGGFKTYTENLIRAISQIDGSNHYLMYIDRPADLSLLPQNSNITYRVIPGSLPILGMPIREQIGLRRSIDRDNLDLVHFLCNTAPAKISKKSIVTLHDVIQVTTAPEFKLYRSFREHKAWAVTAYSKWAILKSAHSAEAVITVSNYEKSRIVESLGVAPERIWVTHEAPNPVFTPASSETKRTWREGVKKTIGVSGRFLLGIGYEKRKNMGLLIESFSKLAPRFQNLSLVIVASQMDGHNKLKNLVEQKKTHNIVILPAVPIDLLVTLYNLAEVFVYPSEREGFGLPPLEALSCGTPTIAMNMASLPEILEDGAMMINGKDPQTWADAIGEVLTNHNLREDLVERGLRQAAKMTWKACAENTLRIYQTVTESP